MKIASIRIFVLPFLIFLICGQALAADGIRWRGSGGWGAGLPYGRNYDPAAEQSLQGTVMRLDRSAPVRGMADGLHLILKTRDGQVSVHLGPVWFLERQDFSLEEGSSVEVVGSRVIFDGASVLIARQVKKADKVLVLRDGEGFPRWSGWRRR
ncbi:MAG: DNA-binding protein [Desulfuromonas sp.]|uniref:hypothetical protein n=1 Tax=Desulfuromonas sp. TaxID=892 RepID=UPI000CBCFA12|nr:hypothetical protein [Desulfuromonas sp.]PLX83231.1 MAG: DNA-binding protein [Desulfuromonas sp.]